MGQNTMSWLLMLPVNSNSSNSYVWLEDICQSPGWMVQSSGVRPDRKVIGRVIMPGIPMFISQNKKKWIFFLTHDDHCVHEPVLHALPPGPERLGGVALTQDGIGEVTGDGSHVWLYQSWKFRSITVFLPRGRDAPK